MIFLTVFVLLDTPICRTVTDDVYILDAIVSFDKNDEVATRKASKYIPHGGYLKHVKSGGLKGKRLGIVRDYPNFGFGNDTEILNKFKKHFMILRYAFQHFFCCTFKSASNNVTLQICVKQDKTVQLW